MFKPWSAEKIIATAPDSFVFVNSLVKVDTPLIEWMS